MRKGVSIAIWFCMGMALQVCAVMSCAAQERWTDEELTEAGTAAGCSYLTQEEKAVYMYTNLARLYPAKYARVEVPVSGDWYVTTLREELLQRQPVGALYPDPEAYEFARCLAEEQSRTGEVSHERHTCAKMSNCTWGENIHYGESTGQEAVLCLLIDRNVSSLGHRENCLNGVYNSLGVSMNRHPKYGMSCVMDFMKKSVEPRAYRVAQQSEKGSGSTTGATTSQRSHTDVTARQSYDPEAVSLSAEEVKLYDLVMQYRAQYGLPVIPISAALTYVAQVHARDVYEHFDEIPYGCNSHSWSSHGPWMRCDYYPDHRNASGMHDKPRELTTYKGSGFEIFHYYLPPTSGNCTAQGALKGWQESPGHNAVIINQSPWEAYQWRAIGIAIYRGCACIWFGREDDEVTIEIVRQAKSEERATTSSERYQTSSERQMSSSERYTSSNERQKTSSERESREETGQRVQRRERSGGMSLKERYYGRSGRSFVSVVSLGYNYSFIGEDHRAELGVLDFRYTFFGMSPLDFEMQVHPVSTWFAYRPSIHGYIPCLSWLAVKLYAGVETDITYLGQYLIRGYKFEYDKNYFLSAFCGASVVFTPHRCFPMEVRVEYQHPIVNKVKDYGIYMSLRFNFGVGRV